jgi:hypothetical protein
MAGNPVHQGMDFCVKIAMKRTYEHLGYKNYQTESICISEGQVLREKCKNCRHGTYCNMMFLFESNML